jgi:hypothetical protein
MNSLIGLSIHDQNFNSQKKTYTTKNLSKIHYLIIDEMFMMGCIMLIKM